MFEDTYVFLPEKLLGSNRSTASAIFNHVLFAQTDAAGQQVAKTNGEGGRLVVITRVFNLSIFVGSSHPFHVILDVLPTRTDFQPSKDAAINLERDLSVPTIQTGNSRTNMKSSEQLHITL